MELNFISPIKLLMFYGIIGFTISSISCIIETFFKCIGNEKKFFCKIENENYDFFIENFFIFFEEFSILQSKEIITLNLFME